MCYVVKYDIWIEWGNTSLCFFVRLAMFIGFRGMMNDTISRFLFSRVEGGQVFAAAVVLSERFPKLAGKIELRA